MINILIITSGLTAGGVDTLILNTLSVMDRRLYHIDLLIFNDSKDDWIDRYKAFGCKVIKIPRVRDSGLFKAIRTYRKIFKDGKYDIIHSHIGFGSTIPVIARLGMSRCKAVTHAHFDNYEGSYINHMLGHIVFNVFPCIKLACSKGAGYALYGDKADFKFIKNGIDTDKFAYEPIIRYEVRNEFRIKDNIFLVGTVGRMQFQKNHDFLIDIFESIISKHPNSMLMLVGDGELRRDIQEKIDRLGMRDKVIFCGIRRDVFRLLQGMDVFIMPTRFEGLSLALLEVQCSGLPCLTSDVVPQEASVTEYCEFISLSKTADYWADRALNYRHHNRHDGTEQIKKANFDKESSAKAWFEIYQKVKV